MPAEANNKNTIHALFCFGVTEMTEKSNEINLFWWVPQSVKFSSFGKSVFTQQKENITVTATIPVFSKCA